jgi:hypothetical protein
MWRPLAVKLTTSIPPEKGYRHIGKQRYQVTMDGRPLMRVLQVDTVTGVAVVCDTNEQGQLYIDPRKPDQVATRRVYGPMRVEPIADDCAVLNREGEGQSLDPARL